MVNLFWSSKNTVNRNQGLVIYLYLNTDLECQRAFVFQCKLFMGNAASGNLKFLFQRKDKNLVSFLLFFLIFNSFKLLSHFFNRAEWVIEIDFWDLRQIACGFLKIFRFYHGIFTTAKNLQVFNGSGESFKKLKNIKNTKPKLNHPLLYGNFPKFQKIIHFKLQIILLRKLCL